SGAVLDVSGIFTNDTGRDVEDRVGSAFINGGRIAIRTQEVSSRSVVPHETTIQPDPDAEDQTPIKATLYNTTADVTGAIRLDQGSRIDANSGAYVKPNGQLQRDGNLVVVGRGGDVSVQTYVVDSFSFGQDSNSLNNRLPDAMPQ